MTLFAHLIFVSVSINRFSLFPKDVAVSIYFRNMYEQFQNIMKMGPISQVVVYLSIYQSIYFRNMYEQFQNIMKMGPISQVVVYLSIYLFIYLF